jgi:hypothetical protein
LKTKYFYYLFVVPAIIEHEDLESGGIGSINPNPFTSTSADKRSKFSAQDLLKQVNIILFRII